MTDARESVMEILLAEILHDTHCYEPGLDQRRPTLVASSVPKPRRLIRAGRERVRDVVERAAHSAGFARRHFDPNRAAERLQRLFELSDGLQATYEALADEPSRRAMVDVLKLRVLGPYHCAVRLTPEVYRDKQAYADRALRTARDTFAVSDPWFSPLSEYSVPVGDGSHVRLHSHSVDVVSVLLLEQYSYLQSPDPVAAGPGDVVLDVGGCWGDTALYFAARVGPEGKVYTFEFDPENLAIMRANLALNPALAPRIKVIERALWDRSGELLQFVQAGRMTTVVASGNRAQEVMTITVDDFVDEEQIDRVDFLKLDVEGAELNVLDGARRTLTSFTPSVGIAAYHKDDDLVQIPAALAATCAEYRFYLETFSAVEEETVVFASRSRADATMARTY